MPEHATQPLPQSRFDELLSKQKGDGYGNSAYHIRYADLSQIQFTDKELDSTVIAMSSLSDKDFDSGYTMHGMTWIGNRIERCRFSGVHMNKAELLDCEFSGCTFSGVSLFRADLTGSIFENCTFSHIECTRIHLVRTQFLNCQFDHVIFPDRVLNGCHNVTYNLEASTRPMPGNGTSP